MLQELYAWNVIDETGIYKLQTEIDKIIGSLDPDKTQCYHCNKWVDRRKSYIPGRDDRQWEYNREIGKYMCDECWDKWLEHEIPG